MRKLPHSERFKAALRAAVLFILGLFITSVGFLISSVLILAGVQGRRLNHLLLRAWSKMVMQFCGVRLTIIGKENLILKKACIVVCNHSSWLDIPILGSSLPGQIRFLAKRELAKIPLLGWFIQLAGHPTIDRANHRLAHQDIQLVKRCALREGFSPVVFPEGGLSRDGRLREFHAGAFYLSQEMDLPIQPVAICGAREIWPPVSWHPVRTGAVVVRIGAAIDPILGYAENGSRRAFAYKVRLAMASLLDAAYS